MTTTADHDRSGTAPLARLRGFHPGWYGAVMGTAIVGIVAYQDPGQITGLHDPLRLFGVLMVALSALLAVGLGVPYVARWLRHPDAARADLTNPVMGALHATFPAGILVLTVGIATVGPSVLAPDTTFALVAVLAVAGIALAFAMSVAFAALLFVSHGVEPQAANGGWFIPPVVTIIVPMALAPLAPRVAATDLGLLLAVGYAFWGMGLLLFLLVASLLYDRLVFHPLPAAPLAPSLWIGLGPLGVGGLALLSLAQIGAPLWGTAAPAVQAMSLIGASALWGFGAWWLAAAVVLLGTYLRRGRFPFGLGWWAFTFPLGAYAASTLALARGWHSGALEALAAVLFIGLVGFWLVVAAGTLRAVRSGDIWRR
ncbi:MAG: SLAC1 family transporter [Candidatus Limnocylindrales bacterium]